MGQHRSTQRREPVRAADDAALRARLREFSEQRPRWGYRRAHASCVRRAGTVNRKRVQRLWREEGLRVPVRRRKRRRLGDSTVPAERLRAERPDQVWALDFQFDQTADGRMLKLLNIVDEFTREALEMLVERSINADHAVAVLERLVAERGAPEHVRCDNGPELTANALRDWCRFSRAATPTSSPARRGRTPTWRASAPGCATSCSMSSSSRCLAEAKVIVADWREDYNQHRPHSALAMMAPAASPPGWWPRPTSRPREHPSPLPERARSGRSRPLGPRALGPPGPRSARPTAGAVPYWRYHPPTSHTRWTNKRGPVTGIASSGVSV